jgi:hypothetical protein
MPRRAGSHYVISGQLLATGAPAYLTAAGLWSTNLQDALAVSKEEERDALQAQAEQQQRTVCDPYFFEVRVERDAIDPLSARERIRAWGPTTRVRRPDRAACDDAGKATP